MAPTTEKWFEEKKKLLKSLNTKDLIESLSKAEDQFDTAVHEYNTFRDLNYAHACSATTDSPAVKARLAELVFEILPSVKTKTDKAMTVQEKEAWLTIQRTKDQALQKAIEAQKNIFFQLENLRNSIEVARERLHGMRAVLELRTAQIRFLSD